MTTFIPWTEEQKALALTLKDRHTPPGGKFPNWKAFAQDPDTAKIGRPFKSVRDWLYWKINPVSYKKAYSTRYKKAYSTRYKKAYSTRYKKILAAKQHKIGPAATGAEHANNEIMPRLNYCPACGCDLRAVIMGIKFSPKP